MKTINWIKNIRRFSVIILLVVTAGCQDDPAAPEEDPLPRQDSGIVAVSERLVEQVIDISLTDPKPFQTIDATDDVLFRFSPSLSFGEVLIFDQRPDIENLRAGITDGCVAGNSKLAGHSWTGTTANLSQVSSSNHFYECLSGVNLLSQTDKKTLTPGTYYWFVLGYDDDYLVSHSSDVRILFLN